MTDKQAYAGLLERLVNRICLEVCELPDRTSPEDWPEACLVTPEELSEVCSGVLTEAISSLLKALEFYADPSGWNEPPIKTRETELGTAYENQASKIRLDRGRIARAALNSDAPLSIGEGDRG